MSPREIKRPTSAAVEEDRVPRDKLGRVPGELQHTSKDADAETLGNLQRLPRTFSISQIIIKSRESMAPERSALNINSSLQE